MSYCRFSSDNFACEVYAYADVSGGYTTHVASSRVVGDIPKADLEPDDLADVDAWKEWSRRSREQTDFVMKAERVRIDLPYDGATFRDPDLTSFKARLTMLREVGYRFPDHVFEQIEAEMAEGEDP